MELKELCLLNGVSGDEKEIRKAIMEKARPLCDSVKIDRMGNVIAFKKGKVGGRHILFNAQRIHQRIGKQHDAAGYQKRCDQEENKIVVEGLQIALHLITALYPKP